MEKDTIPRKPSDPTQVPPSPPPPLLPPETAGAGPPEGPPAPVEATSPLGPMASPEPPPPPSAPPNPGAREEEPPAAQTPAEGVPPAGDPRRSGGGAARRPKARSRGKGAAPGSRRSPGKEGQRKKSPARGPLTEEERQECLDLARMRYGTREIARRLGRSRKAVRACLKECGDSAMSSATSSPAGAVKQGSLLDPFRDAIRERVEKKLRTTRILREIQEMGYQGSRTILGEYVRSLKPTLVAERARRPKRRFETGVAVEIQIDWTPYWVKIAGEKRLVHAFVALLCWARLAFVRVFDNERQTTLLEAMTRMFERYDGATQRVVTDNMSTAVLAASYTQSDVIWHKRYLDFAEHYGFDPIAAKPRDPDRKGKDEKSILDVQEDFFKGIEVESMADLNRRAEIWANRFNTRTHKTTGRVPIEAWRYERDFVTRLPATRFLCCDEEARVVAESTISVRGKLYSLPRELARQKTVVVRLYSEHFEVLDPSGTGRVAYARPYAPESEKAGLIIDPEHAAEFPRPGDDARRSGSHRRGDRFLREFPQLAALVDGIRRKHGQLASIHLGILKRLAREYGDEPFKRAALAAQEDRRWSAHSVRLALERACPEPPSAVELLGSGTRSAFVDAVETGSLDDYSQYDGKPATNSDANPGTDPKQEE